MTIRTNNNYFNILHYKNDGTTQIAPTMLFFQREIIFLSVKYNCQKTLFKFNATSYFSQRVDNTIAGRTGAVSCHRDILLSVEGADDDRAGHWAGLLDGVPAD